MSIFALDSAVVKTQRLFSPYLINMFVLKMSTALISAAYIHVYFTHDFITEANTMNSGQTGIEVIKPEYILDSK